jgi:hypothetical protein
MKTTIITLVFAAACFGSAAVAQGTSNTSTPAVNPGTPAVNTSATAVNTSPAAVSTNSSTVSTADAQKDPVVCGTMYHEGSVIQTGHTCMTKREWAVQHHLLQQSFHDFQMQADQLNR